MKNKILTVFGLFIFAMLVSVLIYPEVFITFKTSFITWYDYCVEYGLSFVLTNFFYQGGIQLWDHFGQMPNAYTFVTFGLFKFQNVMTALVYVLLHPFTDNSAQLYHQAFAWGNLFAHLFLRLSGIFLLISCVTSNRWILMISTVVFALFYSQPAFLWGTFYMSLIPLGAYFLLRFFQYFQLRYLVAIISFGLVCLGSGIIHTGYLNVGLHFIFISALIWSVIFNRDGWVVLFNKLKGPKSFDQWRVVLLIVLLAFLIVGPYVYMIKYCLNDVAFGVETSRISNMFNPAFYFHQLELSLCDPAVFFKDTLNFLGQPSAPVFYIGWIFYVLAILGVVLSRNNLKWFFFMGIVFIWLINFPRDHVNIGHIAHWINFWTNPIKTLARSYYVATETTLPFLLMPLVILGIEELIEMLKLRIYRRREWLVLIVAVGLFTLLNAYGLPLAVIAYLIVAFALLCVIIMWVMAGVDIKPRRCLIGFISFLVILDLGLIVYQSKKDFAMNERKPIIFDAAPQLGMVGHEVQNPTIFPLQQHTTSFFSFYDEVYLWFPRGVSNNVSHITNEGLNFLYINGHSPRSAMFKDWINDEQMKAYVKENNRTMFVAQEAVQEGPQVLGRINEAGLSGDVVMVADTAHQLQLPATWSSQLRPSKEPGLDFNVMSGTISQISTPDYYHLQGDMMIFTIPLPADFPKHLATTWFIDNQQYLHFYFGDGADKWKKFQPVQGEIIKPYTFDVNNIKEGFLTVAFPRDSFASQDKIAFQYPSPRNEGLLNVWSPRYDHLGFNYRVVKSGWFVYNQPYDPKWDIWLDGKKVAYYRVNKSFVGFPISEGEHKILINYWPGSPLRLWLLISAILTNVGLIVLIMFGLIWERKRECHGKY